MFIKRDSRKLLNDLLIGRINTWQFLYGLNRLLTVEPCEPTIVSQLDSGLYLVQTDDHKVIAKLLCSDVEINAKERGANGFVRKIRVIVTEDELSGLHELNEVTVHETV